MTHSTFQGIALILFGLLLCAASPEINGMLLSSLSDLPFSLFGLLAGIAGLVLVFRRTPKE
ncbi:MAG: hypothetical protein HFF17_06960 [Oscillospiraceae bacterium]|nr:hypothetical protein [Oscillospiraceae bacterium]